MTSNQEKILDDLWSRAVRAKAKGKCQWTGQEGHQAAHIVGRRYLSTRWGHKINGKYDLCGCYFSHSVHCAYDGYSPLRSKIIDKLIGRERYNDIIKIAQDIIKPDFETIKKALKDIISNEH